MNRVSFFLMYAAGTIAVWVGGNPRWRVSELSIGFVVSLIASVVLIRIAARRGRSIGRPRLFWVPLLALFFFPVFDLCFSAAQLLNGWLLGHIAWRLSSPPGYLQLPIRIALGVLLPYAPFLFHLACCAIGTLAKPSPGSRLVPGE